MKGISGLLGLIGAVVSILAGLYLLTSESASVDTTVFDALMHGIGAYFIARGLWMIAEVTRGVVRVVNEEPNERAAP